MSSCNGASPHPTLAADVQAVLPWQCPHEAAHDGASLSIGCAVVILAADLYRQAVTLGEDERKVVVVIRDMLCLI